MRLMGKVKSKTGNARAVIDTEAVAREMSEEGGGLVKWITTKSLQVERRAKELCPVDTGRLRSSITSQIERDGATIVGVVGTDVEYASFVEFGTQRMEAQPFLVPAAYAVLQGGGFTLNDAGDSDG